MRPVALLVLGLILLGCGNGAFTRAAATADPASLARELDRAQRAIDKASVSAAKLEKAAQFEQVAFAELADNPDLRRQTLPRLSPPALAAARAAIGAADALAKIAPVERRFPKWRIIAPPPAARLLEYFRASAAAYRLPWQVLAAIELVETRMGRIRGLSPAGARGPMQFMPATWAEYGRGNIDSPRDAIRAAARFLAANGGRNDIRGALFHYNPSRSYVVAVEAYADEMRSDRRAFYAYYQWQVLYRTTKGTFVLPVGYPRLRPRALPR